MENFVELAWKFLNSSLGITLVVSVVTFVMGKIFTAKPAWKKLVIEHGPSVLAAIKFAEKKIPDDSENKALARLDEALKYFMSIEPKISAKLNAEIIKKAITAVHATAEANGNI